MATFTSAYVGPSKVDSGDRRFDLNPPVIRIWNNAGTQCSRTIMFDNAMNQGIYTEGPDWLPDPLQSPGISVAVNGKIWRHWSRVRLHAVWEFIIPHPRFEAHVGYSRPIYSGFTELDLYALEIALIDGSRCEFYPHGHQNDSFSSAYESDIQITKTGRDGVMWQHRIALTVQNITPWTNTRPREL